MDILACLSLHFACGASLETLIFTVPVNINETHKIGVNVNQLAKKANTLGEATPADVQEMKGMLKELWHILKSSPSKQP